MAGAPSSKSKNNFDQSPARRHYNAVKEGGSPSSPLPPPLLNILLLHHRISTRVLFQCSNGELWWPDTERRIPERRSGDTGPRIPRKGGLNKLGGTMHEKILCREAVRLVIVVIALLSLFFFFFLREMYLVVVSS